MFWISLNKDSSSYLSRTNHLFPEPHKVQDLTAEHYSEQRQRVELRWRPPSPINQNGRIVKFVIDYNAEGDSVSTDT